MTQEDLAIIGKNSIDQVDLLSADDMITLEELIPELRHCIETRTLWRTTTEALYSVLNDLRFPTPDSKYHQSKLEQAVFFDQLVMLSFEYRRNLLDQEEIRKKMVDAESYDLKRLQIDLDETKYKLYIMRIEAKERLRELKMWKQIKEDILRINPEIDVDSKDTSQLKSLALRYCKELPSALRSKNAAESINIFGQCETMLRACETHGIDLGKIGSNAKKMLKRS